MPRPSHIPAVATAILALLDDDPKALITNATVAEKAKKDPRIVTSVFSQLVAKGAVRKHGERGIGVTYTAMRRPLKALAA